jgi:hypothetical protein
LVDRDALACETGLSTVTIRTHLRAAGYDPGTGRALYDHDQARAELAGVIPWPAMQGRRRSAFRLTRAQLSPNIDIIAALCPPPVQKPPA